MQRRAGQLGKADQCGRARAAIVSTALLAIALIPGRVQADNAPAAPGPEPINGEFQIGTQGRLILLPVLLGQKKIACLVDTGASLTGFDESLKPILGRPRGTRLLKTPGGTARVEEFDWPDARLGARPLATGQPVVALNLAEIREATNEKIYGVIGMDVLHSCRLQIDFDAGVIRFLEALPEDPRELGEKIELEFVDAGAPYFVGSIGEQASDRFLIDTGAQGNSIAASLFDDLQERKLIQLGRAFASMTVAGELRGERGRLSRLTIGPFTQDGLRVSRISVSSVGLRYLSRFRVTFDFPGKCAYLQKGKDYTRAEPRATSGLTILWFDGEPIVEGVRAGGPGEKAGVKPRDVLLSVDHQPAAQVDPFALRQVLTSVGGRTVPLTVRRKTRELDLEVVLEED
ncbi:MAG TPA: aspartyl protease family protein [Planctomycetaceae bacterium]|jgi:hypothetical protein